MMISAAAVVAPDVPDVALVLAPDEVDD